VIPFPDVVAPRQPSDSLPPSATTPVPLAVASRDADACAVPREADATCAHLRAVRRRRVTGSPPDRAVSRKGEGLPGSGAVLFIRAMVEHPAGEGPLLAHTTEKPWLPAGQSGPWASGKDRGFGAACPMARTCACLRIAEAIADPVARLTTGSGGLTLSRAGCAPAGRQTTFHGGIVSSSPN
jgi:hypothetical protein